VAAPEVSEVLAADPFDLPDWVGTREVTWTLTSSLTSGPKVTGDLGSGPDSLPCDLLGCDAAFPRTVLDDRWRHDAHQAWAYGQVLLLRLDGRLTLAVPGTGFTADLVVETVARLAKAVGAPADRFTVALRL
jgi:hypothetical protein